MMRRSTSRSVFSTLLSGALLGAHCGTDAVQSRDPTSLVSALSRAGVTRSIEPRLSIPTAYRTCSPVLPPGASVPAGRCAGSRVDSIPSPAILALADSTRKRLGVEADPDALHAAAIIDLLWAGSEGIPLERSVSYLRTASRLTDHPAAVLTDLAAALLVRAERHQTGRDLLEAIDAASGAVALEPNNERARFNLALGLERLGLDGQAQRAWRAVLQVDSTSRWAEEARDRPLAPAEVREFPAPPALTAPDSEVAAYAEAAPEAAMLLGWDHVLDSWSAAVIGGDAHGADRLLHSATVIGRELERRGRDATLADGVRAVRALADRPSATLALARAHHEYAIGRLAYRTGDYGAAERSFVQVLRAAGYSAALTRWAQLHRALAQAYQGHLDAALAGLRPVVANADPTRYPSLVGRAHWARGTIALRRGRYEEAIRALESAALLFERTGERENLGTVQYLAADARHYLADPAAEYAAIQRALATLRPFRHSVWLHNLLLVAARFAAADGLPRAAAHLQDEGVEVAERVGDSIHVAEAHIARARLRVAAGMNQAASEDVVAAEGIVRALEPGPRKDWFLADLQLAEAVTSLAGQPSLAVAALDSSARFWASQHNEIRLMPVLITRAETELASGNAPAAAADLDRALALLNEQSTSVASMTLRASLLDAAQHVVDRLVMLRVRSGRPAEALADLEKVRISLASTHRRPGEPAREPPAPAREQVTAEYALVGDTLLIWTIVGGTVQLARSTVDRALLVRAIERVRAALELRADEAALLPDLAALYDWLLRPIEPRLGRRRTPLVLITDGKIAAVPFAALRDAVQGRYLIEDHPLRFASSVRDAVRPERRGAATRARVLLVADPSFDRKAFPELRRLPGAAAEVAAIAAQYAEPHLLTDSAATRPAFETALERASILHYAGHALFDDDRPEQSSLVLAAGAGGRGDGRLTATELERLPLGHVRLVVLSACETIPSRSGHSGGFAGLAGAFLAAGAGGVVGSLWSVNDRLTEELMSEFHRAYRQSGDATDALRRAQLQLLLSAEPVTRSPAAWAGFRYAGD